MSLEGLLSDKKIVEYKPARKQIQDIFELVERDIKDSEIPALSIDRKFISLYSAAHSLVTIVLYINGYRTRGESHHRTTFETGRFLIPEQSGVVEYFDRCRILRNKSKYERSGIISENEVRSIRKRVGYFKKVVEELSKNYIK